jgi:hypothetical protein
MSVWWFIYYEGQHDRNAAARQTLDNMVATWSIPGLKSSVTSQLTEWETSQKPWEAEDVFFDDYY